MRSVCALCGVAAPGWPLKSTSNENFPPASAAAMISIIIAHTTFCIGFVAVIVRARLQGMDESIFEAARDLGATPWQTFRLITLPLIMPAVVAGALMSFTLSIDDFVITFFTKGVGEPILPIHIYTMIKVAVTPEVNAISTLLMLLTLIMIIIATRLETSKSPGENTGSRKAMGQ